VLGKQADAGAVQRAIETEGILADQGQFKEERDYPYKNVQYMQSLLEGLPLETQEYSYYEPSGLQNLYGATSDATGIIGMLTDLLGGDDKVTAPNFSTKPQSEWTTEDWNDWYNATGGMG
jgi:hypothetical protein